jgi:hypothetical protein
LADRRGLNVALNSEEGQDMYLLGALAMAAERTGLVAGPNQVYDFTISPALGGGRLRLSI